MQYLKSMMTSGFMILILLVYLGLLVGAAQLAERKQNSKWTNNPYVYTLSLAVYCSAWTYYGSVGMAANSGLEYLTTYLGPVIAFPAWIVVMRKIIRISRVNKISGIADFISLRYGNSRTLGALVTIIVTLSLLPYIGLQLKAISETFHVVTRTSDAGSLLGDTSAYVALALAAFASFYGTRYGDATQKRRGIVSVIALESVVKLFIFLLLGAYVTWGIFNGFGDIHQQAQALEGFREKTSIGGLEGGFNWFFYCMLSLFAIFLLPHQFLMTVVENNREKHLQTAIWLFPLYLLLCNLFIFPIAWGGNLLVEGGANADMFALLIPMQQGEELLAILVFLGGFSAAVSMIIVSSIALSTMLTNNLLIPYGLVRSLSGSPDTNNQRIVRSRRIAIFVIVVLSYISYRYFLQSHTLVSVGMVAFLVVAQLAPAFFGGIFWRRGSMRGALYGILAGVAVCAYTLVVPFLLHASPSGFDSDRWTGFLNPLALFGLDYLEPIPHALFWSLLVNTSVYLVVTVSRKGNYRERNYAEMYVDIEQYITHHENAFIWRGTAYISDIRKVLVRFLGEEKSSRALRIFNLKYNIPPDTTMADARLIKFAENLLTGHIGSASAKILLQGVTKEDKISLPEVLSILEESKENLAINRKLRATSRELEEISRRLREANQSLIQKDKQKDDFLDTVTHELRTPITAIRAATEILHDDDEIPEPVRRQFLQNIISESDRLNRLIDKILDLERFESGRQKLMLEMIDLTDVARGSGEPLFQLIRSQNISLHWQTANQVMVMADAERMVQVVTNLLSNSIKFCKKDSGVIRVGTHVADGRAQLWVFNNGPAIPDAETEAIFDKFYQSDNQTTRKPVGSGLGLAITRQIVELHQGSIRVENQPDGVTFIVELPIFNADEKNTDS